MNPIKELDQVALQNSAPSRAGCSADIHTDATPIKKTIDEATGNVRETVNQVTSQLPQPVAKPVDDTVAIVQDTVEQVTKTVDGLLKPK